MSTTPVRVAMIGCGGMARAHFRNMLKQTDTTQVAVMCEPSEAQYAASAAMFEAAGQPIPPNQPDLGKLLKDIRGPARRVLHHHAPRQSPRPDEGVSGSRAGCAAGEADGDERGRGPQPDRDARPHRQAARRRVPRQPLTANPGGIASAPLR